MAKQRKFRIRTTSDDPQFNVRLPIELKKEIEARAALYGRDRNPEIVNILGRVIEYNIVFHSGFITVGQRVINLDTDEVPIGAETNLSCCYDGG